VQGGEQHGTCIENVKVIQPAVAVHRESAEQDLWRRK
jgi:hypothetical protein